MVNTSDFKIQINGIFSEYKFIEQNEECRQLNDKIIDFVRTLIKDIEANDTLSEIEAKDLNQLKSELKEIEKIILYIEQHLENTEVKEIGKVFSRLPNTIEEIGDDFYLLPYEAFEALTQTVHVPDMSRVADGKDHFHTVLDDLGRLKDRLGGSPTFGDALPTIDEKENHMTLFGVPMASVKDWFRMVLDKEWKPVFFWTKIAALFNVSKENKMSQYEEAHTRIQRFGMVIANKDKIFEMIDKQDGKELATVTGMAWHLADNAPGTEKLYIDFLETFLSDQYNEAKTEGDDALIEYFNAFKGICFEDRIGYLENYAKAHLPEELAKVAAEVKEIIDIDQSIPMNERGNVFDQIVNYLGSRNYSAELTPKMIIEVLKNERIFEREFGREEGFKTKPTLQEFQNNILEQIELATVEPYPIEEFLTMEWDILLESGKECDEASFRAQLEQRDSANEGFDPYAEVVTDFIQKKFANTI